MTEWSLKELSKYTGHQIKRLREERNWSQDELASKMKTTKTSISNYENGKRTPRFDGLYLLSMIFNVSIDAFFPPRDSVVHENETQNNSVPQRDDGTSEEVINRLDKIVDLLETISNQTSKSTGDES